MRKTICILILIFPILGISQNYKLADKSEPEIVLKKIENDTVSATLITDKEVLKGYVVYRQIKFLVDEKRAGDVYRFPDGFLDNNKKPLKNVLYYDCDEALIDTSTVIWQSGIQYLPNINTYVEDGYTTPYVIAN